MRIYIDALIFVEHCDDRVESAAGEKLVHGLRFVRGTQLGVPLVQKPGPGESLQGAERCQLQVLRFVRVRPVHLHCRDPNRHHIDVI